MSINSIGSGGAGIPSPQPVRVKQPAPAAIEREPVQPQVQVQISDAERLERVQRAAARAANTFVVSDVKFTIFKNSQGEYITRFTSLKDGSVTYFPEPDLLKGFGGGISIDA
jgi:hypothetical protein